MNVLIATNYFKISAIIVILLGVSGCVTALDSLDQGPRVFMAKGLIGGEFGSGLDLAAKRKALDTEIEALTNGNTGAALEWSSGENVKGSVTPGQPFEVAGRVCRRYSHALSGVGIQRIEDATACVNKDGIWEPLK